MGKHPFFSLAMTMLIWFVCSRFFIVEAFPMHQALSSRKILARPSCASSFAPRVASWKRSMVQDEEETQTASLEEDDDDDGWGELRSLQESASKKPAATPAASEERDLFVPIFALVALAGFFGAYAYETLRLYLNGELYLPFSQ